MQGGHRRAHPPRGAPTDCAGDAGSGGLAKVNASDMSSFSTCIISPAIALLDKRLSIMLEMHAAEDRRPRVEICAFSYHERAFLLRVELSM